MNLQPFLIGEGWIEVLDGNDTVRAIFDRRESGDLASTMLASARVCATERFGLDRLFSFVDPRAVRPTMVRGKPVWGFCYYKDGWRFAGLTKKGLHILERVPA